MSRDCCAILNKAQTPWFRTRTDLDIEEIKGRPVAELDVSALTTGEVRLG